MGAVVSTRKGSSRKKIPQRQDAFVKSFCPYFIDLSLQDHLWLQSFALDNSQGVLSAHAGEYQLWQEAQ